MMTREFAKMNGLEIVVGGTNKNNKYKVAWFNKVGFVAEKKHGDGTSRVRLITWDNNAADIAGEFTDNYDFTELTGCGWEGKGGHHVSIVVREEDVKERFDEAIEWLLEREAVEEAEKEPVNTEPEPYVSEYEEELLY